LWTDGWLKMGNLIHDLSCHVRTIQGIRLTLLVHLANPTAPRPASWEVPPKVAFLASMSSLTHAYLGHEQYPFTSSASSLSSNTVERSILSTCGGPSNSSASFNEVIFALRGSNRNLSHPALSPPVRSPTSKCGLNVVGID
jgi:hypothetical protein